jgi:hypothetical protein
MRSGSAASASLSPHTRLLSPHTRLADGDRTDTGHHLALWQVTVPDDAPVTARSSNRHACREVSDLGLDRMSAVKVDRDAAADPLPEGYLDRGLLRGDAAATLG